MPEMETNDLRVRWEDDGSLGERVLDFLIREYYYRHESFEGEVIMQADDPQIEAPQILSELADNVIGFEVEVKDVQEDE